MDTKGRLEGIRCAAMREALDDAPAEMVEELLDVYDEGDATAKAEIHSFFELGRSGRADEFRRRVELN